MNQSLAGVFEGGGAKGIAYAGALRAVRDHGVWFDAVAGSSAGAITAALVAAGLTPDDIEARTTEALSTVRTSRWDGLLRLRRETGYFSNAGLTAWLEEILQDQVDDLSPRKRDSDGPVSFAELYEATGIELNVVSADLTLRHQMVFNHEYTPDCQVADAVAASAAIPFGFRSSDLHVHGTDEKGRPWVHTLVDGGVWSNFPMFVFTDPAYRRWRRKRLDGGDETALSTEANAGDQSAPAGRPAFTLGFLLDEQKANPNDPQDFRHVRFLDQSTDGKAARPAEERIAKSKDNRHRTWGSLTLGLLSWFGAILLFLLWLPVLIVSALVGRFRQPARWTPPSNVLARRFVALGDATLWTLHRPLVGFFVWGVLALGSYLVIREVWTEPAERVLGQTGPALAGDYLDVFLMNPLLTVAVGALLFLLLVGIAVNMFLLRSIRRIGYGLVMTYAAAPGAPPWADEGDPEREKVIRLTIPYGLGMLDFDADLKFRQKAVDDAYRKTRAELRATDALHVDHGVTP